jgi:hypothetical protein
MVQTYKEIFMATLEKIEFEKFGPYRFIGKSVYARSGAGNSGYIFGGLWCNFDWVGKELDKLNEFTTNETDLIALLTWDLYEEQKQLLGYTVGKFMKAGSPVPNGLDYFDIPEMVVAKALVKGEFNDMIANLCPLTSEGIKKQDKYVENWEGFHFSAEVYLKETVPEDGAVSVMGHYRVCKEK